MYHSTAVCLPQIRLIPRAVSWRINGVVSVYAHTRPRTSPKTVTDQVGIYIGLPVVFERCCTNCGTGASKFRRWRITHCFTANGAAYWRGVLRQLHANLPISEDVLVQYFIEQHMHNLAQHAQMRGALQSIIVVDNPDQRLCSAGWNYRYQSRTAAVCPRHPRVFVSSRP